MEEDDEIDLGLFCGIIYTYGVEHRGKISDVECGTGVNEVGREVALTDF